MAPKLYSREEQTRVQLIHETKEQMLYVLLLLQNFYLSHVMVSYTPICFIRKWERIFFCDGKYFQTLCSRQ